MKSSSALLLGIPTLAIFKVGCFPSFTLLLLLFVAMVVDLTTGIAKAYVKGEARTSSGFRKTITKFLQYGGAIATSTILSAVAEMHDMGKASGLLGLMGDGLVVFTIYIEATSIFENLYALDQSSVFSKVIIRPALRILTFQLKNNPALTAIEQDTKPPA